MNPPTSWGPPWGVWHKPNTGDKPWGEAGKGTLRGHREKGNHGQAMGKGNGTPKLFSFHHTLSQHQERVKQSQPC